MDTTYDSAFTTDVDMKKAQKLNVIQEVTSAVENLPQEISGLTQQQKLIIACTMAAAIVLIF